MPRSYISSAPGGGSSGIAIGDTVTGATAGSVFFAGAAGILAQDNTGFFYNNATNQLRLTAGAATDTPLKITLASAQSADAFQIFASDGTTKLFSVDSTGNKIVTSAGLQLRAGGAGNSQWIIESVYEQGNLIADKNTYIGWNSSSNGGVGGGSDTTIGRADAGIIGFYGADGAAGGKIQLSESGSAPSAPAADCVTIYAVDNGAGKTQLMALFSSGAAQQIAIQP